METRHYSASEVKAARVIQRSFLFRAGYTYANFLADLRTLKQGSAKDFHKGVYDNLVKKCARYCVMNEDRAGFHKLAYILFHDLQYYSLYMNCNHANTFMYLLYDDQSNLDICTRVLLNNYEYYKANRNLKPSREESSAELNNFLHNVMKLESKLYKIPGEFFGAAELTTLFDVEIEDDVVESKLDMISEHFWQYIPRLENQSVDNDLSSLMARVSKICKGQEINNPISKTEIQTVLTALDTLAQKYKTTFGKFPVVGKFTCDNVELLASHGGGLYFMYDFLTGKNEGYTVAREEGGLGVYLDPSNGAKNYSPTYYAARYASRHCDVPATITMRVNSRDLYESVRHGKGLDVKNECEVILRAPEAMHAKIDSVNFIEVKDQDKYYLSPKAADCYSDPAVRIQVCESYLRLLSPTGSDRQEWMDYLTQEQLKLRANESLSR